MTTVPDAAVETGSALPFASQDAPPTEAPSTVEGVGWRRAWPEWLIVFLAVILFCWGILDLGSPTRLPGNETEVFQLLDRVLVNSLSLHGAFPLWNPYIFTGVPFVADPMLHIYNPFITLPVLLLGVSDGYKLAIGLSFLIAALGMWRLGAVLGFSRPVRVWVALTFAFAGQPTARFFQGQYLFIFGFAWIPWVISSLFVALRTRRRLHIALAVIFLALLFFSGNDYYQFYMLVAALLFSLVMVVRRRSSRPYIGLDWGAVKTLALIGVLALGLIAIQLLPLAEFWPRLSKDMNLEGAHTLQQIFLDYTSKDTYRPDAYQVLPAREEFYAYIGLLPVAGLLLAPLAIWKGNRRALAFFILLLLFCLAWISVSYAPWRDTFIHTRILLSFRHLLRVLLFGGLALIVLTGMGLDAAWKYLEELPALTGAKAGKRPFTDYLSSLGLALLGFCMLFAALDLFFTNRQHIRDQPVYQPAYRVMNWLRQTDLGIFYVRNSANNAWHDPVVSNDLRYIDVWYHFNDIRNPAAGMNSRPVQARPHYVTQPFGEPAPAEPGAVEVGQVEGYNIYYLPDSLPVVFGVADAKLQEPWEAGPLPRSAVAAYSAFFPSPNQFEVIADSSAVSGSQPNVQSFLVALVSAYPGWQVTVDGRSADLSSVSGYLATGLLPGVHRYVFSFRPRSFFAGLAISLVVLVLTLYLLVSDLRLTRQAMLQGWGSFKDRLRRLRGLPGRVRARWPRTGWQVPAVYRDGGLQLAHPLDLPEGAALQIAILPDMASAPRLAARRWLWATGNLLGALVRSISFEIVLFTGGLLIYLATRLIRLADFPIYFFTDEAIQTLLASDLVRDAFRDPNGILLPTYFKNVYQYNLSVSVYLQIIPFLLFGKSVFVTRAISALVTLLAAACIGLTLRHAFKLPYWWAGALILALIPAWFLHSRTAFETVLMVSFYAAGLYFYVRYRLISPRNLYLALVFFALAFYTYSPGQMVVLVTGVLLFVSDFRYHWQQRATLLRGLGLVVLLVLPYVRFRYDYPTAFQEHLNTLSSYWVEPIPLTQKLALFVGRYLHGLSPAYWFFPNSFDLERHIMKGYGHLPLVALPFMLVGLVVALANYRSAAHRVILITLLAAPAGAALVDLAITRALVMVVPATLLTALGLDWLLTRLEKSRFLTALRHPRRVFSLGVFLLLSLAAFAMLRDALVNGPTWYQNYGLSGMQYGGVQVYGAVKEYLVQNPGAQILISPSWNNGSDIVARFFLDGSWNETAPFSTMPFASTGTIRLESVQDYLFRRGELQDKVFVVTPEEYANVVSSKKFARIQVDRTLPYPNGKPGFFFLRLEYIPNIDQEMQIEAQQRRQPVSSTVMIDGQQVQAVFSRLDMGQIQDIWDNDLGSVARTLEANPFTIELTFPASRAISGLSLSIGDTEVHLIVRLFPDAGSSANGAVGASPAPLEFVADLDGSPHTPLVSLDFGQTIQARSVYLSVQDLRQGQPGNVHIWEIYFR